jgi:hypothetical protein
MIGTKIAKGDNYITFSFFLTATNHNDFYQNLITAVG